MFGEAWKLAIEALDLQQALAGAPVDTPSRCQLLSGPFLKIDQQTPEAVSLEFYLMLLYRAYDIDCTPKYTCTGNNDLMRPITHREAGLGW